MAREGSDFAFPEHLTHCWDFISPLKWRSWIASTVLHTKACNLTSCQQQLEATWKRLSHMLCAGWHWHPKAGFAEIPWPSICGRQQRKISVLQVFFATHSVWFEISGQWRYAHKEANLLLTGSCTFSPQAELNLTEAQASTDFITDLCCTTVLSYFALYRFNLVKQNSSRPSEMNCVPEKTCSGHPTGDILSVFTAKECNHIKRERGRRGNMNNRR